MCVSYQPVAGPPQLGRWPAVKLLRRLLEIQAALWGLLGVALLLAPRWSTEGVLGQAPVGDAAWLRLAGVMSLVLAMIMVLVQQHLDEVWWWSWVFALLEVGVATVCVLHALFGVPAGASAWAWWLLGAVSAALGAGLLLGLGYAGQEKPFA